MWTQTQFEHTEGTVKFGYLGRRVARASLLFISRGASLSLALSRRDEETQSSHTQDIWAKIDARTARYYK